MIFLHYQDEGERAQALVSMARSCQRFDARLAFLSSKTACDSTREAVYKIETPPLTQLSFRSINFPAGEPKNSQEWTGTMIEALQAALRETAGGGSPVVAWIEPPKNGAAGKDFPAFQEALEALSQRASATVIGAFRLADLPARSVLAIAESSNALISAKVAVPRCPAWLISRGLFAGVRGETFREESLEADPLHADISRIEKLAALVQLVAGVAHELGNPLSIISSSLQYLHERLAAANDPASDFTMTALHNVDRMHELLRSMLDFASVKMPRAEQVDLKEAISEVLRFTSAECVRRNITVEVTFEPTLPRAWVDPSGIRQIVLNLIKNALDAMSRGEGRNELRIRTRLGPQRIAVVEVENNGEAIPPHVLANLFRPFYTTKEGGTGLGLYLSRRVAQDHGGELHAENLPDGVRFTLTLPLDR